MFILNLRTFKNLNLGHYYFALYEIIFLIRIQKKVTGNCLNLKDTQIIMWDYYLEHNQSLQFYYFGVN